MRAMANATGGAIAAKVAPLSTKVALQELPVDTVEMAARKAAEDTWAASRSAYGDQLLHPHMDASVKAGATSLTASVQQQEQASQLPALDLDAAAEAAAARDFGALQRGEASSAGLDAARRAVFDGSEQGSSALEQLNQLEMQNQLYRDFFAKYQRHMIEQQASAAMSLLQSRKE